MKKFFKILLWCIVISQFIFAQSMKIHTHSGISEFNLSEIDSVTFTIVEDTVINLTRGLVAYYPFNGNANDLSGNGNNGTIYGAVLADDHLGNSNSAYFFDGIDDYIDVGNDSTLKPQFPLSISVWIHYVSFGVTLPVFSNNSDDTNYFGFYLAVNNTNNIALAYGDGGQIGSSSRRSKRSNTVTSTGVWYHIVGVIRGSQDMELYINGVEDIGSYAGNGDPIMMYNNNPANIGLLDSAISGPENYFSGRIDELRIYNRELNDQEIQALYNE